MNAANLSRSLKKSGVSGLGLAGLVLAVAGFFLGASVHMACFALVGVGAFGPGILRQFRLVDDLDEFQKEAVARAAHRAYLVSGLFLTAVVIARQWGTRHLGDDFVPASLVLTLALAVYGGSYVLSFWDAPKAAAIVLFTVGAFWLVFVALSHGNEPLAALGEGALVAGPFFLTAILARKWPRAAGLLLLALSVGTLFFFHLVPLRPVPAEWIFNKLFVAVLVPLPMAAIGLALLSRAAESRQNENAR